MITPLDQYDLPRMDLAQLDQVLRDLEQDVEEMEWEIEWRTRELRVLRSSIARVRVLRWGKSA